MRQKECAVCGDPISSAGRKSSSGVYYCSKIDCRRERDRLRAQRWRERNAPPPTPLPAATRVFLELNDPDYARRQEELRALVEMRTILLDGGLSREEVDRDFPLPV